MIDGRSDEHLWAESYTRELENILALHSDVAQAIAGQIRIVLTPQEESSLTQFTTVDPDAYKAYLRGRFHFEKRTIESIERAHEYFEQSIAKDSDSALAYAGLADALSMLGPYSSRRPADLLPQARAAAERALQLDGSLPEAHTSHAWVMMWEREWNRAEQSFQQAIGLNPSSAQAHHWYGWLLAGLGRQHDAEREFEQATNFDPLSLIINAAAGWNLYVSRRFEEAREQLQRTLGLDPNFPRAHFYLGQTLLQQRRFDEAIAEHRQALSLSESSLEYLAELGYAYGVAGEDRAGTRDPRSV